MVIAVIVVLMVIAVLFVIAVIVVLLVVVVLAVIVVLLVIAVIVVLLVVAVIVVLLLTFLWMPISCCMPSSVEARYRIGPWFNYNVWRISQACWFKLFRCGSYLTQGCLWGERSCWFA